MYDGCNAHGRNQKYLENVDHKCDRRKPLEDLGVTLRMKWDGKNVDWVYVCEPRGECCFLVHVITILGVP